MGHEGEQALNYAMKLIYLLECGFLSRLNKKGKRYLSETVTVRIVFSKI